MIEHTNYIEFGYFFYIGDLVVSSGHFWQDITGNTAVWRSRTLVSGFHYAPHCRTVTKEDFLCEDFFIITQH